jgi:tryptophan synthase alpha chain
MRALELGMNLQKTLDLIKELRAVHTETPIILMGYYNPIYKYGCDKFIESAAECGVDGLIIVDLPPEEDHEIRPLAQKVGIDIIRLVTPTTVGARLDTVLNGASGFLYYVSITGVTGTKSANIEEISKHIDVIRTKTDLPVAVGFGIKTPEDVRNMSVIADAVIVGSAIVQNMADHKNDSKMKALVESQVQELAQAL